MDVFTIKSWAGGSANLFLSALRAILSSSTLSTRPNGLFLECAILSARPYVLPPSYRSRALAAGGDGGVLVTVSVEGAAEDESSIGSQLQPGAAWANAAFCPAAGLFCRRILILQALPSPAVASDETSRQRALTVDIAAPVCAGVGVAGAVALWRRRRQPPRTPRRGRRRSAEAGGRRRDELLKVAAAGG